MFWRFLRPLSLPAVSVVRSCRGMRSGNSRTVSSADKEYVYHCGDKSRRDCGAFATRCGISAARVGAPLRELHCKRSRHLRRWHAPPRYSDKEITEALSAVNRIAGEPRPSGGETAVVS